MPERIKEQPALRSQTNAPSLGPNTHLNINLKYNSMGIQFQTFWDEVNSGQSTFQKISRTIYLICRLTTLLLNTFKNYVKELSGLMKLSNLLGHQIKFLLYKFHRNIFFFPFKEPLTCFLLRGRQRPVWLRASYENHAI